MKRQLDPLQTVESDSSDVEMASPKALGKCKAVPSAKRRFEEESAPGGYTVQVHKLCVSIRSITTHLNGISCKLDNVLGELNDLESRIV